MEPEQTPAGHDLSKLKIDDRSRHPRGGAGKKLGLFSAAVGLIVIVAGIVFAFRTSKPVVEVAAARGTSTARAATLLNASGYVTPRRRATIAAKITGRVVAVNFDEGMHVREGFILATLDESDARRALESAVADRNASQSAIADLQVQVKFAELELQRAQQLQAQGVQSQEGLDTARTSADSLRAKINLAKSQVAAADARINEAQQAVDNCVIRAPFDGIVVSKDAQPGEMVSPISAGGGFTRTGIATLVDMQSLEVEVDVNEAYIARVHTGQNVNSVLDAYPDWQIPSHVRTVIPTADRQKATVKVRISFNKLDPRILPDMGVKVSFLEDEPKADKKAAGSPAQTVIPGIAVRKEDGKSYVFLVKEGRAERRAVTLGETRGQDVEILAGISQGDSVITKGPAELHDGQPVEIKQ
ncbi:MAG: efflux RND transporter periplasmic adaptor subunit [Candidatus Acidiferrales bacterium]